MAPKKVGPLYLLGPLLITSGSELTLFTFPLLIACPHYLYKQQPMRRHLMKLSHLRNVLGMKAGDGERCEPGDSVVRGPVVWNLGFPLSKGLLGVVSQTTNLNHQVTTS